MSDRDRASPDDELDAEILHALELPADDVAQLLDHTERFCRRHGGARRYAELLALVAECRRLVEKRRALHRVARGFRARSHRRAAS